MTPDENETAPEDIASYPEPPSHGQLRQMKTEFKPWHHPRKQYVRIKQWCEPAQRLIKDLGLGEGDTFRYLTLPGDELLDVRALHGVCDNEKVKLRYLGFNNAGRGSAEQTELNISRNEVEALPSVDQFSSIIEDRLEAIANEKTDAHGKACRGEPFHAINIDLCDAIAHRDFGHRRGSYLEVLQKLLDLQFRTTNPWLLFLTTKTEPALVAPRIKAAFSDAIQKNSVASAAFKIELARLVSSSVDSLEADLDGKWQAQDADFLRLFCAGLGKWLLKVLAAAVPPRELVLVNSCFYHVGPDGPDMLSLAFRCNTERPKAADPFGLLKAAEAKAIFSEEEIAIKLAKAVQECIDLDGLLAVDGALAQKTLEQASRLLVSARCSKQHYDEWGAAQLAKRSGN